MDKKSSKTENWFHFRYILEICYMIWTIMKHQVEKLYGKINVPVKCPSSMTACCSSSSYRPKNINLFFILIFDDAFWYRVWEKVVNISERITQLWIIFCQDFKQLTILHWYHLPKHALDYAFNRCSIEQTMYAVMYYCTKVSYEWEHQLKITLCDRILEN